MLITTFKPATIETPQSSVNPLVESFQTCPFPNRHVTLRVCSHRLTNLPLLGDFITTYAEYVEQIAKLQSLAEAARQTEINDAIKKIKDLMQLHGVTVDDLSSARTAKVTKARATVAAQFKNPETGETWTGRGRAPRWLDGKDREQFRIKS